MARCLVVGGSGHLGRAVCRALAAGGHRLALTYRTGRAAAEELAAGLDGAVALALDLAGPVTAIDEVVDAAAGELAGLDAVVVASGTAVEMECRGAASSHRMANVDPAELDRILAVNTRGPFLVCRRAIPHLTAAGGGNIVLTGAVDGRKPVPSPVHYAITKGALVTMAQAMAKELGGDGIKVNTVGPGVLDGGLAGRIPAELVAEYTTHSALGRVGTVDEVAGLIAWLATVNTYLTGQTVLVDGGL